ncbi:MAG: hypothetical protein H7836_12475 [Magnetococcus sp. YQC-3]
MNILNNINNLIEETSIIFGNKLINNPYKFNEIPARNELRQAYINQFTKLGTFDQDIRFGNLDRNFIVKGNK